jgi:hypothetical protein
MFTFVGRDMAHRGEHVRGVSGCTFDAVAVVYPALAGFVVNVKELQIVVEVDGAGTQISTEESGVGGEYRRNVNSSFSAEGEGNSG